MTDIAKQLDRLTSPNKNKRYDACEELRVASDLPPEAISALEAASNDPSPDVADAARRALLVHKPVEGGSILTEADSSPGVALEVAGLSVPEAPEVKEVASLYKSIRSWAIFSIFWGGLSIFASGTFNPGWGIVLIVIGILSWRIKSPSMFIIYGVMMGWAALINASLVLQTRQVWWFIVVLLQIYGTFSIVKQYRKYRHLRLRELYESGAWSGNLPPPVDEVLLANRFATASTILAGITMLIPPIACFGIFVYTIAKDPAFLEQAASLNRLTVDMTVFVVEVLIGMAVLALGLGLAAMLSRSKRKGLAIAGTVMSALVLVGMIIIMLLGILSTYLPLPEVAPVTG